MRAHPRGCGADPSSVHGLKLMPGSSPRVRGRLVDNCPHQCPVGLIPAGAGQTSRHSRRHHRRRAHPRGCGADFRRAISHPAALGSSPRVRGRRLPVAEHVVHLGLIPAGAGQTPHTALWQTPWGAHPRRCGADWQARKTGGVVEGSSPRVRGRPCRRSCRVVSTVRAHPRGCGADPK